MGTYTSIKFTAPITKEAEEVISIVSTDYRGWGAALRQVRLPLEWLMDKRAGFIPRGGLCYAPEGWEYRNEVVNGVWSCCCGLKNYTGTIELFLAKVLPLLLRYACKVEVFCEEDEAPRVELIHPAKPKQD